jgi:class 3 adenylate cyclase/tetratricopeptide (TPR) repeat protein
MTFNDVLSQTIAMLQQHGRMSYRALKRQFALDDAFLEDLKYELTEVQQLTVDYGGTVLVWTGGVRPAAPISAPATVHRQEPLAYTPSHLAEKILTTRAALEGERKQVTVLFADLKGSMELLADRDPEEARQLLDPVLDLMMAAVHRYEGTVNQVMGDGIMALFGAPIAHEDHAVRACYAALAMQTAVHQYATEVQRTYGVPIQIRVGLNAGEVVVRAIGNDLHMDYSAIGQTTHLAARMEQMAMPGSILMTQAVLGLVEGYVQATPLGPVPVKGLTEPVAVFELVGASGIQRRFQATAVRGLTHFVGRDTELAVLLQAMERAAAGTGQVGALIGEAGVGKSRLVYELLQASQTQGWRILESAAVSYGQAVPYLPVIDLLRRYTTIEERDDPRNIRTKVTERVLTLDESLQDTIPALLLLLDALPEGHAFLQLEPPQRRQRILEACKRVLLRESQEHPLLLIFEDLHWTDTETQTLLNSLVESLPVVRLLLLVTYRPEYQHGWGSKTYYTQLRLDPLSSGSAEALLQGLLGDDPRLASLQRLLSARTAGNPFFLEESVRTLVETGILVGTLGAYCLTQDVTTIQVPATVQAMLAARIDRLPADAKQLLQTAAVIGTEVPLPLLQAIAEMPEDVLQRHLTHLQAAEFLDETRLFPERAFTFKHALTYEVAYGSLLTTRRQALHLAAGRALEVLYADRLEDVDELLAYHYAKTTEADKAVEYLTRFARKATRGYALVEAVTALHEALRHVEHLPGEAQDRRRLDLVLRLARAFTALGRLPETLDLLVHEQACVERLQEPRLAGPYHFRLGHTASNLGDHARAAQHGQRALAAATQCGDTATMSRAYFLLSIEGVWTGHCLQGATYGQQAITLLEQTGDQGWLGLACCALGFNYTGLGELERAMETYTRASAIGDALGDARLQSMAAGVSAFTYALQGNWQAGIEAGQRALARAPDPYRTAASMAYLGYAYLEKPDPAEAIPLLAQAAQHQQQFRALQNASWSTTWLGEAYRLQGQLVRARDLALQGLAIARDINFRLGVGWAQRALGRLALANNALAEAKQHLQEALQTFTATQARAEIARTTLDMATLAYAQERQEAAVTHLHDAYTLFRDLRVPLYIQRTRALAASCGISLTEAKEG